MQPAAVSGFSFSPGGDRLLAVTRDDARIWDLTSGALIAALGTGVPLRAGAWRDADRIALLGEDDQLRELGLDGVERGTLDRETWRLGAENGAALLLHVEARGGELVIERPDGVRGAVPLAEANGFDAVGLSADGSAVAVSIGGALHVWHRDGDAPAHRSFELQEASAIQLRALDLSDDGERVMFGYLESGPYSPGGDAAIDTRTGEPFLQTGWDNYHTYRSAEVVPSPGGADFLQVRRHDGWTLERRGPDVKWQHTADPFSVVDAAFTPDGAHVVAAIGPAGLRLLDAATGAVERDRFGVGVEEPAPVLHLDNGYDPHEVWGCLLSGGDGPVVRLEGDGLSCYLASPEEEETEEALGDAPVERWSLVGDHPVRQVQLDAATIEATAWDRSGQKIVTVRFASPAFLRDVAVAPDLRLAGVRDGAVVVVEPGGAARVEPGSADATAAVFLADGSLLIARGAGRIEHGGEQAVGEPVPQRFGEVTADGFVTVGSDRGERRWTLSPLALVSTRFVLTADRGAIEYAPDGAYTATGAAADLVQLPACLRR